MLATAHPTPVTPVEHLLVVAPKERRIDLAIASLLFTINKKMALVTKGGTQTISPIWYFSRYNSPAVMALCTL